MIPGAAAGAVAISRESGQALIVIFFGEVGRMTALVYPAPESEPAAVKRILEHPFQASEAPGDT